MNTPLNARTVVPTTYSYNDIFLIQYKNLFYGQDGVSNDDARVRLLREDPEDREPPQAPAWAGKVEGLNYQISRCVHLMLAVLFSAISQLSHLSIPVNLHDCQHLCPKLGVSSQ